jgi:heterodisulfide reductase subunit C/quinone-modifying oxidoreductase subunit QmoC
MVENYGLSFELGLATRHYLKHYPLRLPGMAPMSFGLLTRKRISIVPRRIKKMDQLRAILDKAKQLELAS